MIPVWLKVRMRANNLDLVLKSLNYWISVFSNKEKYDLYIYSEDIDLPADYNCYKIIRKNNLLDDIECQKIFNQIQTSCIDNRWKPAAFALSAPYFYLKTEKLVYNIDADDILIFGPVKKYIQNLENKFNEFNLDTISYDMHYSVHQGGFFNFRPNHWSFGLNLSNRQFMKKLILKCFFSQNVPTAPWGNNIDYLIDINLEKGHSPYYAFATPSQFIHYWAINANLDEDYKGIKYIGNNKIESKLFGKTTIAEKNPKTLILE